MSQSEAEKLFEWLAQELRECIGNFADGEGESQGTENKAVEDDFLRVLRDSGLLALIEAGSKMRERMSVIPTFSEDRKAITAWDAAWEAMRRMVKT